MVVVVRPVPLRHHVPMMAAVRVRRVVERSLWRAADDVPRIVAVLNPMAPSQMLS
jgi:hypothetical protein